MGVAMYQNTKAVLFDLDGTIYYGSQLIPGAMETVGFFREHGKKVFFMTNNSTKTRQQICEKLTNMGLTCSLSEVYTSGYAAAVYAKQLGYKQVYIFGTESLSKEFRQYNIENTENAKVVIIGYDMDFDYKKLTAALQVALQADTVIACNKETHYPGENAKRLPGCGAMVGALEGSLGREVDYVVGKPNSLLLDIICNQQGLNRDELLLIGDTYESDIKMCENYGCGSIYIGSEVHEGTVTVKEIGEVPELVNSTIGGKL